MKKLKVILNQIKKLHKIKDISKWKKEPKTVDLIEKKMIDCQRIKAFVTQLGLFYTAHCKTV